jgi:hypothetical protein
MTEWTESVIVFPRYFTFGAHALGIGTLISDRVLSTYGIGTGGTAGAVQVCMRSLVSHVLGRTGPRDLGMLAGSRATNHRRAVTGVNSAGASGARNPSAAGPLDGGTVGAHPEKEATTIVTPNIPKLVLIVTSL